MPRINAFPGIKRQFALVGISSHLLCRDGAVNNFYRLEQPLLSTLWSVPLERPDRQHCQAAEGYVELGIFLEADTELDKIDPFNRAAPELLATRLAIYRGLKKWELMQQIAKRLKEFEPENVQWTISLAYATRRAFSTDIAMEILVNAEARFPKEGAIPYNLACYYCQLREIEKAKCYLKKRLKLI